jgi:hypothetical protein
LADTQLDVAATNSDTLGNYSTVTEYFTTENYCVWLSADAQLIFLSIQKPSQVLTMALNV